MKHPHQLITLLSLILFLSCQIINVNSPDLNLKIATSDFTLKDMDGKTQSLKDYLYKKVILINFWATWCSPCVAEMPFLNSLYTKYKDQGFVLLSISMDGPDTVAKVKPFMNVYGYQFPVLLDTETYAVRLYNPKRAAPFSILIDKKANLVKTYEGFNPNEQKAISDLIEKLLTTN